MDYPMQLPEAILLKEKHEVIRFQCTLIVGMPYYYCYIDSTNCIQWIQSAIQWVRPLHFQWTSLCVWIYKIKLLWFDPCTGTPYVLRSIYADAVFAIQIRYFCTENKTETLSGRISRKMCCFCYRSIFFFFQFLRRRKENERIVQCTSVYMDRTMWVWVWNVFLVDES